MVNIIPKPNLIIDKEKQKLINGFNIICPEILKEGILLFKREFKDYLNKDYKINVLVKNFKRK